MRILIAAIALTIAVAPASRAGEAKVRQSVNLRAGPGMDQPVTGTAAEGEVVGVGPCSPKDWCEVTAGKAKGWAYGRFLTLPPGTRAPAKMPPDDTDPHAYVAAHPQPDVILDGDLVIGAGIPHGITLHPIPGSDRQYLTINGKTVLVDQDRRVTRIYD